MNDSKFDVLAALVLSGEATDQQKLEFEEMLRASRKNQMAFEKLKQVWDIDFADSKELYHQRKQYLWARYQAERNLQKNNGLRKGRFMKVAATILLLLSASFVFYWFYLQDSGYFREQANTNERIIIKSTNSGEKLRTRLPDGTGVYLNAGSQLTYSEHFSDSDRVVQLTGEGYFDVAEDKERPFTVRVQTMDITALGTSFSVNAYSKNVQDQVALVSGKLLIKSIKNEQIRIKGGQTITLSRDSFQLTKSDLDYLTQIAWKDGLLYFDNNSFNEIIDILELNYGVEFTVDKNLNLASGNYTGSFKNESLENLLNVISFSMNFNYEIYGKKVLIKNS